MTTRSDSYCQRFTSVNITEHSSFCAFFLMVLEEPILCKSSMSFFGHLIFARLLKNGGLFSWVLYLCLMHVFNMIDAMHHVAAVLWKSQSCRSCFSDLQ